MSVEYLIAHKHTLKIVNLNIFHGDVKENVMKCILRLIDWLIVCLLSFCSLEVSRAQLYTLLEVYAVALREGNIIWSKDVNY